MEKLALVDDIIFSNAFTQLGLSQSWKCGQPQSLQQ